jgi:hypothetical protein
MWVAMHKRRRRPPRASRRPHPSETTLPTHLAAMPRHITALLLAAVIAVSVPATASEAPPAHALIFQLSANCAPGPCQRAVEAELRERCSKVRVKARLRMASATCAGPSAEAAGAAVVEDVPGVTSFAEDHVVQIDI